MENVPDPLGLLGGLGDGVGLRGSRGAHHSLNGAALVADQVAELEVAAEQLAGLVRT